MYAFNHVTEYYRELANIRLALLWNHIQVFSGTWLQTFKLIIKYKSIGNMRSNIGYRRVWFKLQIKHPRALERRQMNV